MRAAHSDLFEGGQKELFTFRGRILNPISPRTIQDLVDGCLVVDGNGRIVQIGDWSKITSSLKTRVFDFRGQLIVPGLIDLHTHLPQYGLPPPDESDFLSWFEHLVYAAEKKFTDANYARKLANRFFTDLLANGTTTACIFTTTKATSTHVCFEEAEKVGVRVIMGKDNMDRNVPDDFLEETDQSVATSLDLCGRWHGKDSGRLLYAFSPRSASVCSKGLLRSIGEAAKSTKAYIQTHLAENLEDISWFREQHGSNVNYTGLYNQCGILGPRTIVGHAVFLRPSELQLIKESRTAIAHCPGSNLLLRSGLFDILDVTSSRLLVGLGSDVGATPRPSIFDTMRDAISMERACRLTRQGLVSWRNFSTKKTRSLSKDALSARFTAENAFYMATQGAARALKLEANIGSFGVGKEADFLVLDLPSTYTKRRGQHLSSDIIGLLAWQGGKELVQRVFIRGREVYRA